MNAGDVRGLINALLTGVVYLLMPTVPDADPCSMKLVPRYVPYIFVFPFILPVSVINSITGIFLIHKMYKQRREFNTDHSTQGQRVKNCLSVLLFASMGYVPTLTKIVIPLWISLHVLKSCLVPSLSHASDLCPT